MKKLLSDCVKTVWLFFWAGSSCIIFFLPVVVAAHMGKTGRLAFALGRLWTRFICLVSGVKVKVCGLNNVDPEKSYIIISNHRSLFDIPALMETRLQFRWVMKKELLWIPLFGYAAKAMGNIVVDRKDHKKAVEQLNHGITNLLPGISVMFFPEGTRSTGRGLLPFKKGAFVTAIETGLPILPITINGSGHVLPKKRLAFRPGTIEVVIGEPIITKNYTRDRIEELMALTKQRILSAYRHDYDEHQNP